ncbi:MAG: thiol protease/hemagglutinin PrtT [Bacteroides sp.]
MRRLKLLISFFVALLVGTLYGAPIDMRRAQELAQQQLQDVQPLRGSGYKLKLVYTSTGVPIRGENAAEQKDYYVFNLQSGNGFVIVAGDDNIEHPVVAYSLESKFGVEGLPVHIKNWLDILAMRIQEARKEVRGEQLLDVYKDKTTPIEPLMPGIIWDQEDPYNMLTPQKAPTGCLATAMAQIMRYHCWPRESRGKIRYTDSRGRFRKYDFGHKLDWEQMVNYYNKKATDEQRAAVALLMVECGFAAQMSYTPYGSGAYLSNGFLGLRKYFDYGPRMRYLQQIHYKIEDWVDIIMKELKEKRPVLYGGAAFGVGHAFVLDGYDGKGKFHFNWGWSGLSNGYYSLSDMLPKAQSTGGGGEGGYNMLADIIVGWEAMPKSTVEKEDPNVSVYEVVINTAATYSQNTKLEGESALRLTGLANYGYDEIEFRPGLQLIAENGKEQTIFWADDEEIQHMDGCTFASEKIAIPANFSKIPDGIYEIFPVYMITGETQVRRMPFMPRYGRKMVTVGEGKIKFSKTENAPRLKVTWKTPILRRDSYNNVEYEIENIGNTAYTSVIGAGWSDKKIATERPENTQHFIFVRSLRLEVGEKQTFQDLFPDFPDDIDANFVHFYWDSSNGTDQTQMLEVGGRYFPIEFFGVAEFEKKKAYEFGEDYTARVENLTTEVRQGEYLEFDIKIKNAEKDEAVDTGLRIYFFNKSTIDTIAIHRVGTCYLPPNHEETIHVRYPVLWPPRDGYYFHVLYQVVELEKNPENEKKPKRIARYIDFEPDVEGKFTVLPPDAPALPVPDYAQGTSVEDSQWKDLKIVPNPFKDNLHVSLPQNDVLHFRDYMLLNAQGQEVQRGLFLENEMDISTENLPAGVYLLRIHLENGATKTYRLVKS